MQGKTRIAVLVSGGGTNLQAILDAQGKGIIKSGEVALVISSNPKAYAIFRAKSAGIPAKVITKTKNPVNEYDVPITACDSSSEVETAIIQVLEESGIEIIVLAGYMSILSEDFVKRYDERILNVHPSLIPSFCGEGFYGIHVHEAALAKGVKVTGATVHFVNEIPDGGRIVEQKAVRVMSDDTPETLQRRVMEEAEWVILPEAIERISYEHLHK